MSLFFYSYAIILGIKQILFLCNLGIIVVSLLSNKFSNFQDGALIDDLDNFEPIPLIDAVIPEALAARAANILHSAVQNSDAARDLGLSNIESMDVDIQTDSQIMLNGHESEVFSCTWNSTSKVLATGLVFLILY